MKKLVCTSAIALAIAMTTFTGCHSDSPATAQKTEPEVVDVIDYYENGAIKMRGRSVDGKREGRWEAYYPSGYKWSEVHYKSGEKDGLSTVYYDNGMMRYTGNYAHDQRSGMWAFYDSLGVLVRRINMDLEDVDEGKIFNDAAGQ